MVKNICEYCNYRLNCKGDKKDVYHRQICVFVSAKTNSDKNNNIITLTLKLYSVCGLKQLRILPLNMIRKPIVKIK